MGPARETGYIGVMKLPGDTEPIETMAPAEQGSLDCRVSQDQ